MVESYQVAFWILNCFRYVFCCSYSHNVAPNGKYIAFITTEAETDNPEIELKPGIELLGPVDEIFFDTYDRYEPSNQNDADNCFISTVCVLHTLCFFLFLNVCIPKSNLEIIFLKFGCAAELWCHNPLWVHCKRCDCDVWWDNWKGNVCYWSWY